ncbi:MAG TPA: hypothetical protein VGN63_06510 [Flavisolibacter sp.]|jgi:hypothetical protein|nr:hypothetical protein [Flavisolibacter sp.]
MRLSFVVTKPRPTLEKQWAFLVQRGQENERKTLGAMFLLLLILTILYLLFYFLTAVNNFIVFKGVAMVMLALAWCVSAILFLLHITFGKRREKRRLQRFLTAFPDAALRYSVQIDEEKVVIISTDETFEFPWTEFTAFGVHQETLYVFNTVNGIHSLYWDRSEIGSEAYTGLLEILEEKAIKRAF